MTPTPRLVPDRPSDAALAAAFWQAWDAATSLKLPAESTYLGAIIAEARAAAPPAEAPAERGESRFFIDHGIVHDRKTGRHVGAALEDDSADRLMALLREIENDAAAWRLTAKAMAAAPAAPAEGDALSDEVIGQLAWRAGFDMRKEDDDNEVTEDWRWPDCDGCGGAEGFDQLRKFANLVRSAPRVTGGREECRHDWVMDQEAMSYHCCQKCGEVRRDP